MQLNHEKLDVYQAAVEFLALAFQIIEKMPATLTLTTTSTFTDTFLQRTGKFKFLALWLRNVG